MSLKTIAIIPTYNEAQNIERLILQVIYFQPGLDILVVDDNSPDGTSTIVQKLSGKFTNLELLRQPKKSGLGRAYIEGFRYAVSHDPPYERIIQMDADFSHHPKYLGELVNGAQRNDISIGSRYIPEGKIFKWKLHRRLLSYFANLFVSWWLNLDQYFVKNRLVWR